MTQSETLALLSLVESIGKLSLQMYQDIQEMKKEDPDQIDLAQELKFEEQLNSIINIRMAYRQKIIDNLEK